MVRLEEIIIIHDFKRRGLSVSAIPRQTVLDRKTVRKQLADGVNLPAQASLRNSVAFSAAMSQTVDCDP